MRFSAKIVKRDWDILCIPGLPGRHQDWLARARLKNTLRSARFDDEQGKQEEDQLEEGHIREVVDEQCYIFDREHFTWALAEESLFEKALEAEHVNKKEAKRQTTSNLLAMASNLEAMASNLLAICH